MEGRRRHAGEPARIGVLRQFARRTGVGEQAPERAIGAVDRLADEAVKIRIAIASEAALSTVKQPRGPCGPLR